MRNSSQSSVEGWNFMLKRVRQNLNSASKSERYKDLAELASRRISGSRPGTATGQTGNERSLTGDQLSAKQLKLNIEADCGGGPGGSRSLSKVKNSNVTADNIERLLEVARRILVRGKVNLRARAV